MLSDTQWAFLKDLHRLINFLIDNGVKTTGEELKRPDREQLRRYNDGESNIKTGGGHQEKRAIDLNFWINNILTTSKKKIKFIGDYWKSLSPKNVWGGDFKVPSGVWDCGHFEKLK